jgi:putative flippase GtrA
VSVLKKVMSSQLSKQFIKYGLVGILNTIITIIIIFSMMKLLNFSYIFSNAVGFIFGFINSFILNRIWTFKSKKSMGMESLLYIIIFAVSYIFQLILLIVLKEELQVKPEYAQIVSIIFYSILNFSGNKYITFKK